MHDSLCTHNLLEQQLPLLSVIEELMKRDIQDMNETDLEQICPECGMYEF